MGKKSIRFPDFRAGNLKSKRSEILKDAVPKLTQVAFLQRGAAAELQLKELRPAALALKLKLVEIETQPDAKDLENAFQTAKQKQVGSIMTTSAISFFAERKRIVELAVQYRLPAIYPQKEFVMRADSWPTGLTPLICTSAPPTT